MGRFSPDTPLGVVPPPTTVLESRLSSGTDLQGPLLRTSIPDDPGRGHPGRLTRQHGLVPDGGEHHGPDGRDGRWLCVGTDGELGTSPQAP